MINLSDYLGEIMAEITRARVQADVESVRLADYYANHPLLKVFPVPRFRLPTVTIDVPVAIAGGPRKRGKTFDVARARTAVAGAVVEQLRECGAKLTANDQRRVLAAVKKHLASVRVDETVSTSAVAMADGATLAAAAALPEEAFGTELERGELVDLLRERTRAALLALLPQPAHISVVTNTAELRELKPETLTRLALSITEQGLEWKGDGTKQGGAKKLLPE